MEVTRDIPFATRLRADGREEVLRAELTHPGADAPLVLLAHGGGFRKGSRHNPGLARIGMALNEAGFATATVDYRLNTSMDELPEQVHPILTQNIRRVKKRGLPVPDNLMSTRMMGAVLDLSEAVGFFSTQPQISGPPMILGVSAGAIAGMTLAHPPAGMDLHQPAAVISIVGLVPFPWNLSAAGAPALMIGAGRDRVIPAKSLPIAGRWAARNAAPVERHMLPDARHNKINLAEATLPNGVNALSHCIAFLRTHAG
ncbi:acetyl esterase/lipase [Rubricella aquisinus]|uniref:Acetyl esterase/lipase n=1 Tax=Rubricella aquisinus TaxID=2028108 RepID=A0A840X3M5_9RHOB|nr:hypothetical protein [Rubricella aquisinus]MBB5516406.1 acetyl esterase/lipase [Rubricella aquisinus]